MKTSDSCLISQYQKGDEQALAKLIQKHQQELFSFIFYKVKDDDLANDFFQDTFIKIIIKLKEGKYTEEDKFILWAKRIASNLIIDHFRVKSRHITVSETSYMDDEFSIFDTIKETDFNVEEQLILSQIHEDLKNIIVFLPENQQEIIKMRFYDELTFKEIAELTNTSINTTLGRMRYALMNIRKIIAENKIVLTS
ncbi:MAG: RNA polymerase sigma factor [Flavobacteriaceae bacterium]|jgi:RNA polymerase sigma factor, sigma-70 family